MTNDIESLKQRAIINERILTEMNTPMIKRGQGVECLIDDEQGYAVPICLRDFKRSYCGCEGIPDMHSCPYGYTNDNRCRNSGTIKCCIERCLVESSIDLVNIN